MYSGRVESEIHTPEQYKYFVFQANEILDK